MKYSLSNHISSFEQNKYPEPGNFSISPLPFGLLMDSEKDPTRPFLLEKDYLDILRFIERLNKCESTGDLESIFKSDLLKLLKADACVYGWTDTDFKKTSLIGVVNIPSPTKEIIANILPYDPVGSYCLENSRNVIAYDVDLPRSQIPKFVNKFFEDHTNLESKDHPYFFELETMVAVFDLPNPSVGLGIHRGKGKASAWTYREVRILELLRPHIIHSIKSLGIKFELEKHKALNQAIIDLPTPIAIFDQNREVYRTNPAYQEWSKQGGEADIATQLERLDADVFSGGDEFEERIREPDLSLPMIARKDGVYQLEITRTANIRGVSGHLWVVKVLNSKGPYAQANLKMQKAELSKREMEIGYLARDGFKVKQIAERLFISPATVETHLKKIYKKLGVTNRTQLLLKLMDDKPPREE